MTEPVPVPAPVEPLPAPVEAMAPPQPSPEQLQALAEAERAYVQAQAWVEAQPDVAGVIRDAATLAKRIAHETLDAAGKGGCVGPQCHQSERALQSAVAYLKQVPGSEAIVSELQAIVADSRKLAREHLQRSADAHARAAKPWTPPPAPQAQPNPQTIFEAAYRRAWEDFQRQQAQQPEAPPRPLL